jgi:hypothetical protein
VLWEQNGSENGPSAGAPRQHVGDEPMSLDDYRIRDPQYRSDADLPAAYASFPIICSPSTFSEQAFDMFGIVLGKASPSSTSPSAS